MNSSSILWPPLTNFPFVSGRVATTNDIALNRALFVQQSNNGQSIGKPLTIKIPQYAFHTDEQTHQRTPCVIIQAEESEAGQVIGALTVPDGHGLVGLYEEFEFLGDTPPKSQ